MVKTVAMTQRVELATVMDRLAVDALITEYAVTVDDGDWAAYRRLFTPDGRADHRPAGGIEGDAGDVAEWLAGALGPYGARQHLVVNRRVVFDTLDGDAGNTARAQADYVSVLRAAGGEEGPGAPDLVCGGRIAFGLLRTDDGWRLREVSVREKWRRAGGAPGVPVTG